MNIVKLVSGDGRYWLTRLVLQRGLVLAGVVPCDASRSTSNSLCPSNSRTPIRRLVTMLNHSVEGRMLYRADITL
jgi:hypothetical protein